MPAALLPFLLAAASAAAPQWQVRHEPDGHTCRAILDGETIDTQIVRSNDGKLVLAPGSPNWDTHEGDTPLTLQIDDKPPVALKGSALFRTVFVLVEDDALTASLEGATTLKWHFPWGDYQATVTGLGAAFDKIGKC